MNSPDDQTACSCGTGGRCHNQLPSACNQTVQAFNLDNNQHGQASDLTTSIFCKPENFVSHLDAGTDEHHPNFEDTGSHRTFYQQLQNPECISEDRVLRKRPCIQTKKRVGGHILTQVNHTCCILPLKCSHVLDGPACGSLGTTRGCRR